MLRFRVRGAVSTPVENDELKAVCASMIQSQLHVLELKAVTDDGLVELGVRRELVPMFRDHLRSFELDLKARRKEENGRQVERCLDV